MILALLLAAPATDAQRRDRPAGEWHYIGGDVAHTRYSPLDQIDATNFERLEVAWTWRGDNFGPSVDVLFRSTPLYVDGLLYTVAGERRTVAAIDPATGETNWTYREQRTTRFDRGMRNNYGKDVAFAEVDGRNLRQLGGPDLRGLVGTQGGQFLPQTADPRHAVQAQELSQFTWRMILQFLDRLDWAQRHKPEQGKNLQRRVVTAQRQETAIEMPEETVLFESGQGTEYAAEGDITAGFVSRGCPTGQQADGGRHAFDHPRTGEAKAIGGRGVLDSPLGFVAGFDVVGLPRRSSVVAGSVRTGRLGELSLLDGFAKTGGSTCAAART